MTDEAESSTVAGSVAPWLGCWLQRGGEAIPLEKMGDRCTVRFQAASAELTEVVAELAQQEVAVQALTPMPTLHLVELQVRAADLEETMATLRQRPDVAFVSHVYRLPASQAAVYLTDQITIQFFDTVGSDQMRAIASSLGLQVIKLIAGVPKAFVFQVTARAQENPIKLANRLQQHPSVAWVEPNIAVALAALPVESERVESEPSQPNREHVFQSESVWEITQGRRSVVVAVADRSIDISHPNLQGFGKQVGPLTLTATGWPRLEAGDRGTLCARVAIAAGTPAGLAPDCGLMPIALGDWLDDQGMEQVMDWVVEQGADVLCWSGWPQVGYFPLSLRQRVALGRAATQGRQGRGCVVLCVAGNGHPGQDGDRCLNGWALHPDAIAVAALSEGVALDAASETAAGATVAASGHWGGWHSPAIAPAFVAGLVGLMLSINPNLTAAQVRQILESTAEKEWGARGAIAYNGLGYSSLVGYGRVNGWNAVQQAQQRQRYYLPARWVQRRNNNTVPIPDGDLTGAISVIEIEEAGQVEDIEISLTVEHDFLGDVAIYLIAPQGETVLLQSRSLGRSRHLRRTYSLKTTPYLKAVLNQPAQGIWRLKLVDHALGHQGRLTFWQLDLGL